MMVPIYMARVASFVNRTMDMDSDKAEALVEEQALAFENKKDFLIEKWQEGLIDVDADSTLENS